MGLDVEEDSQHFQAPHRSEGSVLDAADVVFIQLTAEHNEGKEKHLVRKKQGFLSPLGSGKSPVNHLFLILVAHGLQQGASQAVYRHS